MSRYAAFLRGLNVGGRTAKGPSLVAPLEAAGFENVSAFLASGNLVFDTTSPKAGLEAKIEAALQQALGFEVATFVRSGDELRKIAEIASSASLKPGDGEAVHVSFLRKPPSAAARRAIAEASRPDDVLEVHGRELFWLRRGKMMETTLPKGSTPEELVGRDSTSRNMNTIHRLLAKYY